MVTVVVAFTLPLLVVIVLVDVAAGAASGSWLALLGDGCDGTAGGWARLVEWVGLGWLARDSIVEKMLPDERNIGSVVKATATVGGRYSGGKRRFGARIFCGSKADFRRWTKDRLESSWEFRMA